MEIKAPSFPESITEGMLAQWYQSEGQFVERDVPLADVETEKTTIEIPAPVSGKLVSILKAEGDTVESEEVIALFEQGENLSLNEEGTSGNVEAESARSANASTSVGVSPAARKLAGEHGIAIDAVRGTGRSGRVTKEDVLQHISSLKRSKVDEQDKKSTTKSVAPPIVDGGSADTGERVERRVPMTRLRATIASRLVEAQRNAAMLTTFNEANMAPIMKMRERYQEEFTARHNGTRLGFMGFFVRASVEALKRFPSVNASIDGSDIVYHGFYDIGVAVSTDRGLVVPVVRDADALGLAQIEDRIIDFSQRARANKLAIEDMQGGTFTISNGGVFGSLLSTPILNPPQTAILGMHKIQERPVVENGEIIIRPMMYLALSYDHRLIDGQEAVRFLVTIKGMLEDPARILLEL